MIDGSALDTLVVDRRPGQRNPGVSKTVRATRRRLLAEAIPDETSADRLIAQTGRRAIGHAAIMLVLVSVTSLAGTFILGTPTPLLWGAVTSALYLGFAMLLRARARAAERRGNEVGGKDARGFPEPLVQALHLPLAACWAWFVALECAEGCGVGAAVFRADALLVAMATAALLHANVRLAVVITFLPATLVMAAQTGGAGAADLAMLDLAMLGKVVGGLALFAFVSARMRSSNLESLRLAYEKDVLIGELETANAISDSARHRAEEANLAKSRFLASMSHELRTPLNAIMGFSEVMREEILGPVENPTYAGYVRDIHRSGRHLLSLINEILDLSRVEADRYPLDFRPHQLGEIARSAVVTLRVKAQQKGLKVELRIHPGLLAVRVDERAMRQTFLNLVSNAIKFTPQNGAIDIAVGPTAGGGQYVTVSDNGPGIPQDELQLVLSAFGQGSIALKHAEAGTGLGLAIVQALVGKHDGRFILASELRRGTRASVVLPASRVVDPHAPPRANDVAPDLAEALAA